MIFTNTRLGNFAKDPAVVKFSGRYFLYYSIMHRDTGKLGVGIAVSTDMEDWQDAGELPLTQPCEEKGVGAPAAIVLDGKVHMFYQTYGNWKDDAICHAVSDDGVTFIKDETNPVYRPTDDWCCGRAIDADVCVFGDKLMLFIATRDRAMKIQKLGCAAAPMTSGFHRGDFVQQTVGSILSPELVWEGECIEAPATVVRNGRVYMFYGGSYNCKPQQIGCAVSSDGVHFDRVSNEPIIPCGKPGAWNSSESGHPYAFEDDDGTLYLFYQGSSDMGKTWYLSRARIEFNGDMPYATEFYE